MVVAPPLLVGSSGVRSRSSWTSAVAWPRALSLGLDLWVSCVSCQVHFWTDGAVPCGAGGGAGGGVDSGAAVPSVLTDRHSIYSLLCLFSYVYMFIPLCHVSLGTLKGVI